MKKVRRRVRRPIGSSLTARQIEKLEDRTLLSANVLNFHGNQSNNGVNSQETTLTPANVVGGDFVKIASTPVDGQVYAQPLYVSDVTINGDTHNVVYVATEHDSVYAIDADNGDLLWHDSFLGPGVTTVPTADTKSPAQAPELGVTATPVIDLGTHSLYVLANTKEVEADGTHYVYKLHALDLSTGAENLGGPLTIADTICNDPLAKDGGDYTYVSGPSIGGTGVGSVDGTLSFNALRELGQPALTEVDGNIYMAFCSHPDIDPAHGWVLGVNAKTMNLFAAWCDTPNGDLGGIWMSGNPITADAAGNLYVTTGNGTFDSALNAQGLPSQGDYGDSIVKLALDPDSGPTNQNVNGYGLKVVGYFTPSNQQELNTDDLDLDSSGTVLLPNAAGSAANPNLLIAGGKQGTIYLVNPDDMGGFNPSGDQVVQEPPNLVGTVFSAPAWFNGTLYWDALGGPLKAFPLTNGHLTTTPSSESADTSSYPSSTPTISANGTSDGIVWVVASGANELRAYNANNLADELFNSGPAGSKNALGLAQKTSVPVVADGHVFVGTQNSLVIYGLFSQIPVHANGNQKFVNAAYEELLGRPADPSGLNWWTKALDAGMSRGFLTNALSHSAEYYTDLIQADYLKYLGRAADPAGLKSWVALMQAGLSDEMAEAYFVGSPEFFTHAGGTNKDWVDAMYEDLLGRAPDKAGEASWVAALNAGENRSVVAYDFAHCPEREADRITADYVKFLGRTPSATEVSGWVNAFELGFSNEDVVAGFTASDEFFAKYSA